MCVVNHSFRALAPVFSATAAALLLAACGASDDDSAEAPDQAETQSSTTDGTDAQQSEAGDGEAPAHSAEFDDSPLGQMNAEVFDLINASEPTEASDWDDHLDEALSALMPAEELAGVINQQVQPAGPWGLEAFTPVSEFASVSVITSAEERWSMELSIDEDTELINGLNFSPLPGAEDSVESFDEITERLDALPVETTMLVVEDDQTLYERAADQVMPLSSTAKLYVLYALAEAIGSGDASWEDTLVVTDELRSLPTGQLQEEEAGYEVSVADAAALMISISDNTATDMIIDYLGRDAVEEAVAEAGHHDPALLRPYLMTGDVFHLRWADPDLGEQFLNADEEGRTEIVESLAEETLDLDPADMSAESAAGQELEWFGTAEDVLVVHQVLVEAGEEHPEITEILTANPALMTEPEDPWWDEVAYKGGSMLEALSGSWTVSDAEGRERTVVVLIHGEDPAEVQSLLGPIFGMAQDAFTLDD